MAEDFVFETTYMAYITNKPYSYPNDDASQMRHDQSLGTGWQIIPGILWSHFATPKAWFKFICDFEAYHVVGIEHTVFNMVPLTEQLAIQRTNTFSAFNSCIYAWGATDELYETNWYNWWTTESMSQRFRNLKFKEGHYLYPDTKDTWHRYDLPEFIYNCPQTRTLNSTSEDYPHAGTFNPTLNNSRPNPTGIFWDPLNDPNSIMELRPGKNAITFSWNCHSCDSGKWFNLDQMAWLYPYGPYGPYPEYKPKPNTGRYYSSVDPDMMSYFYDKTQDTSGSEKPLNDFTVPNLAFMPVVPIHNFWNEVASSIILDPSYWSKLPNMYKPGTEYEAYAYPPTQHFLKLIPLFDNNSTIIPCYANLSIRSKLICKGKKRRSNLYAPTIGPWRWEDLYSSRTRDLNFKPALIRYRTGGKRFTWQNECGAPSPYQNAAFAHPRRTPYADNPNTDKVPTGDGAYGTYTTAHYGQNKPKPTIRVTFHKDSEDVQIEEIPIQPSAPPMEVEEPSVRRKLYPPINLGTPM